MSFKHRLSSRFINVIFFFFFLFSGCLLVVYMCDLGAQRMGQVGCVCCLCRNWENHCKDEQSGRAQWKLSMERDFVRVDSRFARRFFKRNGGLPFQAHCFHGMSLLSSFKISIPSSCFLLSRVYFDQEI